jgi:putative glutamine amidotransferase
MSSMPLIGVSACTRQLGLQPFHIAGDKYLRAVATAAGGMPLIIPALGELLDVPTLLEGFDGLLFTGSPSNVEPLHYQGPSSDPGTHHDPERDSTTLPLIRAAVAIGIPVLGICRGYQEMNVAFGGSLHQKVHEVAGLMDHREPAEEALALQYAARHPVQVQPGGLLERIGLYGQVSVNSLHGQGVERLAPGLRIEALAPDGLIEAFSVEAARRFALGVQWHPEWQVQENPPYLSIFQAFGEACRDRRRERLGG